MMSPVDIMVAALARQLNMVVLTTDHDFQLLPDIKTEDWTT
jgi:predicted nucleic acid-binding protein